LPAIRYDLGVLNFNQLLLLHIYSSNVAIDPKIRDDDISNFNGH